MRCYSDVVQDASGNGVAAATVTVTVTADGSSALLYSGDGVGLYPDNTVQTDNLGRFSFYAADNRYTIYASKGGVTKLLTDVEIVDAAAFANSIALLQGYAHTLSGSSSQVIVTPDGSGNLTLSTPQSIDTTSDVQFRDLTHRSLQGSGTPSVTWGTGAGASGVPTSGSISGADMYPSISFQPSATPAASALIAQINFGAGHVFSVPPLVLMIPTSAQARNLFSNTLGPGVLNVTTNSFQFISVSALSAANTYSYTFLVLGK